MVKYGIYGYLQAMLHSQPFGLFHGRLAPYKTAKINAPAWLLTSHAHSHPFGALHGRLAPYNKKRENISL